MSYQVLKTGSTYLYRIIFFIHTFIHQYTYLLSTYMCVYIHIYVLFIYLFIYLFIFATVYSNFFMPLISFEVVILYIIVTFDESTYNFHKATALFTLQKSLECYITKFYLGYHFGRWD